MRAAVWVALLVGCSNQHLDARDAALDAVPAIDAPHATCPCCTKLPVAASKIFDVIGDGATAYISFTPPTSSQTELATLPLGGGAPTMLATADSFTLATFQNAVFYGARSNATYELHQLVGTVDMVLGSVTSIVPITMAANATDLYVLGSTDGNTSTLWRLARTGGAGSMPPIVTTASGSPGAFALGSTVMALNGELVSIADPSMTTPLHLASYAFSGDTGFGLWSQIVTSHTYEWHVEELTPMLSHIDGYDVPVGGGYYGLMADDHRLYYVDISASGNSLPPIFMPFLSSHSVDGAAGVGCAWPSEYLSQDTSHLYGLETIAPDQWVIDVLAKP